MDEPQQEQVWSAADYVGALRRRWKVAAATAAVIALIGVGTAVLWPPTYRSTATILIEQQEIPQDLVRSTITSFADQRIQLINQRVMTTVNLLQIIREHGLYAEDFDRKPREAIIERMRKDIKLDMISANVVDPRSGQPTSATIAFTLSYDNRSPQVAARVANQITSLYLQGNSENRRQQAAEASTFLADETKRLSVEIATLEGRLAEFKQANVDKLPELAGLNQQFLTRAEQDLSDVQRQRSMLDERRAYLTAQLGQLSPNRETSTPEGDITMEPAERLHSLEAYLANVGGVYTADHPDVVRTRKAIASLRAQLGTAGQSAADIEAELAALRAQQSELRQRYEPQHPDVVRVEHQIEAAVARLREAQAGPPPVVRATNPAYVQLQAQLASDTTERDSLQAKERELRRRIDDLEKRLSQTPAVERDYAALARDLESARLKHHEVSTKQREAVVAQNLEMDAKAEHFSLIEAPLVPERPISPNRWLIVALAALLALLGAGAGVAVREVFDSSVKGPADFQRLFGIAPLGIIPAILTADDQRVRGRRQVQVAAATAVALVAVIVFAHFFIAPLDALWFGALRRFGI